MDCRFVQNQKIFNIIEERVNKCIEKLNQDKKNGDIKIKTDSAFPFEISENDIHIVKIYALIRESYIDLGDMITFVRFSEETELEEIL